MFFSSPFSSVSFRDCTVVRTERQWKRRKKVAMTSRYRRTGIGCWMYGGAHRAPVENTAHCWLEERSDDVIARCYWPTVEWRQAESAPPLAGEQNSWLGTRPLLNGVPYALPQRLIVAPGSRPLRYPSNLIKGLIKTPARPIGPMEAYENARWPPPTRPWYAL